jgi:signal transduction histidine kinase
VSKRENTELKIGSRMTETTTTAESIKAVFPDETLRGAPTIIATGYTTRIIRDEEEIFRETKRMLEDTSRRYSIISPSSELVFAQDNLLPQIVTIHEKRSSGQHEGLRWITRIDGTNIAAAKKLMELGTIIRHVAQNPIENFGVSEKEVGVTFSIADANQKRISGLFSNDPLYVEHYTTMFNELWQSGVDASLRIREMEEGLTEPTMRILRNHLQTQQQYLDLINQAKKEVMLILPSTNSYMRESKIGVIDALQRCASRGVKVSILSPDPSGKLGMIGGSEKLRYLIEHKAIPEATAPNTVIVLVVDRMSSLIIELQDDSKQNFGEAIGVATYSTRDSTVKANIRFFERLWEEQTLLESERRSRRQAELLQDIITHDIRNYSQITRLSAELIEDELTNNGSVKSLVRSLVQSIDDSNQLLERAKRLGKVFSEQRPILYPVEIESALENAISIVKGGTTGKRVIDDRQRLSLEKDGSDSPARVLADDLLYEVFLNLYSNSVRYTDREDVRVETTIEEARSPEDLTTDSSFWKVTIADWGRGIPESEKPKIFSRYLESAKGSGLGMSIVRALVVDRYKGKVDIRNRVPDDYTKGTIVDIYLPKA